MVAWRKRSKRIIEGRKKEEAAYEKKLASYGDISRVWLKPTDPDPFTDNPRLAL